MLYLFPFCEMLMRLVFFAGQQLYAVFGSIFLGMSDGKTFDLDSLNTLSRWTPSKVRDDAFYQSKIIQRLILPLFWLLVRNMLNMMFFLFWSFQGFGSPHDVAVSRDGEALYVVQIGPNSVHKFALEWSTSSSDYITWLYSLMIY